MIVAKQIFENMINSPVRTFKGRVEVYEDSTLVLLCGCHDRLKSFTVERAGEEGKFFGYGICQKLEVQLLDRNRELNITKNNRLEVEFGVDADYIYPCPVFFAEEISRDENTNDLKVVAYDALYKAREYKVSDLALPTSHTLKAFAAACANKLGLPIAIDEVAAESFNLYFPDGANFEGTETIRRALDAIAEVTQTVYYVNNNWELVFRRLDVTGAPLVTIDKTKYITLQSKANVQLGAIVHTTELGDTVSAGEGITQYVRDNPFWELREDVGTLVDNALNAIGGVSANPFECDWRGNFLLEIGDKIGLVTKDDSIITSYILNDTFAFNGALSGKSRWVHKEDKAETANNPTSLGVALNQTFARVDKVNRRIDLVVDTTDSHTNAISALQINSDSISGSVQKVQESTNKQIEDLNDEITTTKEELAQFKISADNALLTFKTTVEENGVTKVDTGTGFLFDENGLNISKTNSEISTTITEDGMKVARNNESVLVANNTGVNALNLHATTYLIIGNTSRLEDWNGRTACFWIGG